MSVIYLGNILGATGPKGPTGPFGCPSCFNFNQNEWSRDTNSFKITAFSASTSFFTSCWTIGEVITITGRNSNNVPISEVNIILEIDTVNSRITTNATLNYFDPLYKITICHGSLIGPTGPSQGPSGPTGPSGPIGPTGPVGPACSGTSVDALNLNDATTDVGKTVNITTESGKCWTVGQLIIVSYLNSTINYLIGKVTSYSGTTLSFEIKKRVGTINNNQWVINVTGDLGPSGPTGPVGSIGGTGPTGAIGATGPRTLRGANDTYVELNGGQLDLDCSTTDMFNCNLNMSTTLSFSNVSVGQIIYFKIKAINTVSSLSWSNPAGGTIYWENGVTPTQTSSTGKSTLYKFVKMQANGQGVYLGAFWGDYNI